MILPYALRLLCQCFASFFLLNAACSLLVLFFSKAFLRHAETRTAISAARLLLALRLLPSALGALFVVGLCVPSYLWLEPGGTTEKVGVPCLLFAVFGGTTWLVSLVRSSRSVLSSWLLRRQFASGAPENIASTAVPSMIVVEEDSPILALSGLFHPRPLVSRGVLNSLSADELDAALSHEQAHRLSHDNLKRLLLLLAPDAFPFVRALRRFDEHWSKLAEWSADDRSAQGDSRRAISLASALVRVARLGAASRLPELSTSLLACDRDLSARVQRLLGPFPADRRKDSQPHPLVRRLAYLSAANLALLLVAPLLPHIHELLEHLFR